MYVYIFVDSQHYLPTLLPTENQIIKYERVQFLDKSCCLREFVTSIPRDKQSLFIRSAK